MTHLYDRRRLGFWLGVLLLALLPFAQIADSVWAADVVHPVGQEHEDEEEENAEDNGEEDGEEAAPAVSLATGRAEATVVQPGRAIVTARGNHTIIDSPGPLGGPNETYNPLDAFLGGVLTCALFVYETAAGEMGITLDSLAGSVETDFAVQGLIDGSVNPRLQVIRLSIEMEGPTAEEAEQLREQYMTRCPFYTTLVRSMPIEVEHVGLDEAEGEAGSSAGMAMDHGENAPPGPTVAFRVDLPITDAVDQVGIVQMKLQFDPGAWTPPHVHGGHTIVTVLDGAITNNIDDVETTYGPGEGWQEQPNAPHMAGNDSDEVGHVVVTFATPPDAPLTTVMEGMVEGELPPGPVGISRGEMTSENVPAEYTLVQLGLDFAPGAWTPLHYHGGDVLITVLEGEMTLRLDGEEFTYGEGESWIEPAGRVHAAGNNSDAPARVSGSFVLPIGAALTTVVEE